MVPDIDAVTITLEDGGTAVAAWNPSRRSGRVEHDSSFGRRRVEGHVRKFEPSKCRINIA